MGKIITRFLVVLVAVLALGFYVSPWHIWGESFDFLQKDYKLGLDLQGGIELDYKVDLEELRAEPDYSKSKERSVIEGLKSIIDRRVEVLNINDSQITSANYGGEEHIIVQIPLKWNSSLENEENIKKAKEAIGRVVKIEFKEKRTEITQEDKMERLKIAEQALSEAQNSSYDFSLTAQKYKDSYENVDIWTLSWTTEDLSKYFNTEKVETTWIFWNVLIWQGKDIIAFDGENIETISSGTGYYILDVGSVQGEETKTYTLDYIFITQKPSEWQAAQDEKGRILNDKYFVKSSVQYNEAFQPMIELTFNNEGAEIFGSITRRLVWEQLAIFVGGQMLTAPNVNEAILSGKAVITGNYSPEEAKKLSQDINTWVVPAPIYLTSERSIDSRLGANSLSALIYAGGAWVILIFIFLLFTYRISGIIASFSLILYLLITLSLVKMFGVVLTLASIAGLVLSIGMAIDANILIFERIKDEIKKGEKFDKALKEGFSKSFSAIWDSNLTGLIVALILFIFGINLIKWFGLMLAIGIVVSLFVFYYITRFFLFLFKNIKIENKCFIGLNIKELKE